MSLKFKFSVFFAVLMVVLLAANSAWRNHVEEERVEGEMLVSAQMLATEMDGVWDFMEINQGQFIKNPDGTYNVYCVVAAKVIAKKFTNASDGIIVHYTNLETRKPYDSPDEFEVAALNILLEDPELEFYYELTDYQDGRALRYVEPLYLTESCLECHGEPAGEIDVMGFPKEGRVEGDLAGAISIIIPADSYLVGAHSDFLRETAFFAALFTCCIAATLFCVSRVVTRPIRKLSAVSESIRRNEFDVDLEGIGYRDELSDLAARFKAMANDLQAVYDNLESEVEARTAQLKEANAQLEEQRTELEAMNAILRRDTKLQNDFLATMSHEIRTPLTSILAFADIWEQADVARSEDERRIVEEMKFSSQALLAMVNDMLDVARLDAGRTELELQAVDVADLLADVAEVNLFLAERKGTSILVHVGHGIPPLMTDAEKLCRVLENLVSNAVKFSDEGGKVEVAATYENGTLHITVEDDGCGIPTEDIPIIFERFARGSNHEQGLRRSYGSSGLGLSLVKEMMELMGGDIDVESTVGVGSVFHIAVPATEADGADFGI